MDDIKIRYVVKDCDENISIKIFSLKEIEDGQLNYWLSGFNCSEIKIISRDLFTGVQSEGIDAYEGDVYQIDRGRLGKYYIYIYFDNVSGSFAFKFCKTGKLLGVIAKWRIKYRKIIRNIHQNPELIENEG